MNRRVYGIIGIGSYMANWNADFTHYPKSLGTGQIFGSDKALKYSIRNHMIQNGGKVLFFKSMKLDNKGKLQPNDLKERYEEVFQEDLKESTLSTKVLDNLLSADDVMNFGATFAESKQNISILGITQIGQGLNKYEDTLITTQDILSPFRNSSDKGESSSQTTLGTHTITDEAHYVYPFVVNPRAISMYKNILPNISYSKENYEFFKQGAIYGATLLNSANKIGCENELSLFVELKEESKKYLPSLDDLVKVTKEDGKVVYDIKEITELLESIKDEIESCELYVNNSKIKVEGLTELYQVKDIVTLQTV